MVKKKAKKRSVANKPREQVSPPPGWAPSPGPSPATTGHWIGLPIPIIAAIIMAAAAIVAALIPFILRFGTAPSERQLEGLPLPAGLVLFDATVWREQITNGLREIVHTPQTELISVLGKIGVGIPDADVERQLTYSKPREDALEIQYEFTGSTELGVHLLIRGYQGDATRLVHLDEYEDGDIFLRLKPIPIVESSDVNDVQPVRFALRLKHGSTSFWDEVSHSSEDGDLHKPSGWWDIRIPIKPYVDQMKKAGSTEPDWSRLDSVLIYFADRYSSPPRGRFWLGAIVLTHKRTAAN